MPQHNLQLAHKIKVSFLILHLVFLSMPNFSASHGRISTISAILIGSDQVLVPYIPHFLSERLRCNPLPQPYPPHLQIHLPPQISHHFPLHQGELTSEKSNEKTTTHRSIPPTRSDRVALFTPLSINTRYPLIPPTPAT
jgi:hypothetical protein